MKVLLPTSLPLEASAPKGAETVYYEARAPIPPEHRDAEVIVLWASSASWLARTAAELPRLRLVQSLMAGTDAVEAAGFAHSATICSGAGLHDVTVAEHALGLILAAARRLDVAVRAVDDHRWARELTVNQPLTNRDSFTMVRGSRIVIWGFGGIGKQLARYLTAMGANVTGVARAPGSRDGTRVITVDELPEVLPAADVLVNILPATPDTHGIVTPDILRLLPQKAWLVNVGRGATVDEPGLIQALREGVIAGAALDVTAREPLPADDPLWGAPNLILTPHSAGGRPQGSEVLIEENVAALMSGAPLRNVVRPGH